MKSVYLASMASKSGKSVLSLGLVTNYPGKVGYYKPFRESTVQVDGETMDKDALLMAEAFNMEEGKKLSPFVYDLYEPISMDDIVAGYEELRKGKEFMIIEGSRAPANGYAHSLSHVDIAKALGVPMLLVSPATPQAVDTIFVFIEKCRNRGIEILGVIINGAADCPERKFLEDRGIRVLGEIPVLPELRTFKVSEIEGLMNMKVIAGKGGMNNIVETMLVGAMSIQSAIGYMRRSKRKVMITGGDRTEMLLAALSTDTSCIIVTGGIRPAHTVLSRADEINVPVLMTNEDTLHITEVIEHLIVRIDPKDKEKIELVRKTVRSHVDLESIWNH